MFNYKKEQIFHSKSNILSDFSELWNYKELLYFFSWRDIKVKYKQTFLGIIWVVLQPVLLITIYSIIFQKLWDQNQFKVPYILFLLPGLLFWTFFSSTVTTAAASLVNNSSMIKKIYFPRIIIPISCISVSFIDLIISLVLLVFIKLFIPFDIHWMDFCIYFPISMVSVLFSTLGFSLLFSSLNLKYRDFRFIVPFFIQVLMFLSPVIYSQGMIQNEFFNMIIYINPISAPIELVRYAIIGFEPNWILILSSEISSLVLAIVGFVIFKRSEHLFADFA